MSNSRRDFLGFGTAAALATVVPGTARAARAGAPIPPGAQSAHGALRLVTYLPANGGATRVGAVRPSGHVVDLGAVAKAKRVKPGFDVTSMLSLIAAGAPALAQARKLAGEGGDDGPLVSRCTCCRRSRCRCATSMRWAGTTWSISRKAPPRRTRNCRSTRCSSPRAATPSTARTIPIPFDAKVSEKIDWEGELAVVIGRRGRNIAEADAMNYVFGFAVINDTTARDMQQYHGGQWFKGKSLDGHGPIGPWIVPAADLDYTNLHLMTRVNGVMKQDINTSKMYFKVPRIIAELSLGLTLEPGDIIASGTPSGVGASRNPPEFLKPGDVLETEIVEIGVIRNVITPVSSV